MDPPEALGALRIAGTAKERISALKQIKNDIIGHERKKEAVIRNGIVELLVTALGSGKSKGKKRSLSSIEAGRTNRLQVSNSVEDWDVEDQLRLQTVLVVTSIAHGEDPSFGLLC